MGVVSGFILCSLIVTLAYLYGILIFINDHEVNKCEMTFMYEYPQFIRINLDAGPRFRKYGLYAYSEGRFTYNARSMKFTGIPILFIPGNAGSYRQVRSLASVSLRKGLDDRPGFHFDFFAVNFNDEFSGLNGALLEEQTEYVNRSIYRIFDLYNSNQKSIILFGHSMGGLIARGLLTVLEERIVPLIITLATPHLRPPLMLDSYMYDYYHRLKNTNKSTNSTIVSLSGGYNDYMIAPFITNQRDLKNLHVFSPAVPKVWLPIDHLCILWCKQLVLALTKGLFDTIDIKTKRISEDPEYLRAVFHHHLVKNNGIKIRPFQSVHSSQLVVFGKGRADWIENLQKQYTISLRDGVPKMQYHMIRILDDTDYRYLTIVALNIEVVEWVFACSATELVGQRRICSDGIHLSHFSEIIPSVRFKRKMLKLDTLELKRNYTEVTHVIVRLLPTSEPVTIQIDRYNEPERKISIQMPSMLTFERQMILNETHEKALHYELVLPQLTHIMQAYKLNLKLLKCNSKQHHATASLVVPWDNQNLHKHFTELDQNSFLMRLHTSRLINHNQSASVVLTLDPVCRYSVSIRYNIPGSMGQIARIYTPLLLPNIVAVILLTFRNQLFSIAETESCSMFFSATQYGIKPYYLLPLAKLASRILSWKGLPHFLALPDWHIISDEGNDFLVLPLILYMTSVGIVWLVALALLATLVFYETTFHKLACKFLARTVTGSQKLSDWILSALRKLPGIVAIILVLLSITTCGGLSLCLGCIFYFLKLTQMSQDYIEQLVLRVLKYFACKLTRKPPLESKETPTSDDNHTNKKEALPPIKGGNDRCVENKMEELSGMNQSSNEGSKTEPEESVENTRPIAETVEQLDSNGIFFHFSIFMLWCIMAGLSVPSVLTWAHNFRYSTVLQPDPSFIPGLLLSACALPLWQMELPRTNLCEYSCLGHVLSLLAGISLIYSSVFLHRINYIVTLTIILTTCHQMFAPKYQSSNESDINDSAPTETESQTTIHDIKAKWE